MYKQVSKHKHETFMYDGTPLERIMNVIDTWLCKWLW